MNIEQYIIEYYPNYDKLDEKNITETDTGYMFSYIRNGFIATKFVSSQEYTDWLINRRDDIIDNL